MRSCPDQILKLAWRVEPATSRMLLFWGQRVSVSSNISVTRIGKWNVLQLSSSDPSWQLRIPSHLSSCAMQWLFLHSNSFLVHSANMHWILAGGIQQTTIDTVNCVYILVGMLHMSEESQKVRRKPYVGLYPTCTCKGVFFETFLNFDTDKLIQSLHWCQVDALGVIH